VFGDARTMQRIAATLADLPGATHVAQARAADGSGRALLTADVHSEAADAALSAVEEHGVPPDDVWLLRLDGFQPGRRRSPGGAIVWADLLGQAGEHARPVGRYLAFMAVAGVIAGYGVIYANGILIVGAMAVSPDFLPIAAACIGLASRHRRLVARAFTTLWIGLGVAGVTAGLLSALLDLLGLLPASFSPEAGVLEGLTTVNSSTFGVALAAGVAGILALETRAGAAVGVAISVTTIPASAYLGVTAGVGEITKAAGALAVLGINVAMLLTGGTLTLLTQRALSRRASRPGRARPRVAPPPADRPAGAGGAGSSGTRRPPPR
jgi:uncharacterized hydrophobic protein (TIGR00271 family)